MAANPNKRVHRRVHVEGERTITVTFDSYESVEGVKFEKEIHRSAGTPNGCRDPIHKDRDKPAIRCLAVLGYGHELANVRRGIPALRHELAHELLRSDRRVSRSKASSQGRGRSYGFCLIAGRSPSKRDCLSPTISDVQQRFLALDRKPPLHPAGSFADAGRV